MTYGKGGCNNHHAFQTSVRHRLAWWEIDTTYIAVRLMRIVGIAHSLKYAKLPPGGAKYVDADGIVSPETDEPRELVVASNRGAETMGSPINSERVRHPTGAAGLVRLCTPVERIAGLAGRQK